MDNADTRIVTLFRRVTGFALGFIAALPECGPSMLGRGTDRTVTWLQNAMRGDFQYGWYAGYDCVADFACRKTFVGLA